MGPDDGSPFWNQNHAWTVVDNTGAGGVALSGLTIAGYGTNGVGMEGSFGTSVGNGPGGDLVLHWTSTVPEPSALVLLAIGAVSLLACVFRQTRQERSSTALPPAAETILSSEDERASQDSGPIILSLPSRWTGSAQRAA